jgi:hypothetical protein
VILLVGGLFYVLFFTPPATCREDSFLGMISAFAAGWGNPSASSR